MWPTPTDTIRRRRARGPPGRDRTASGRMPRRRRYLGTRLGPRSGAAPTARGRRRRRRHGTTSRTRSAAPSSRPTAPCRSRVPDAAPRTRAPSALPHDPPVTSQRSTPRCVSESLDVRDQVRRRVARQVDVGPARVRGAPAAVPLVEQDDPVRLRIEQPRLPRRAARARPAVQHDCGLAKRIPACLPVHEVAVAHVEQAVLERLDLWVRAAGRPGHAEHCDRPTPWWLSRLSSSSHPALTMLSSPESQGGLDDRTVHR